MKKGLLGIFLILILTFCSVIFLPTVVLADNIPASPGEDWSDKDDCSTTKFTKRPDGLVVGGTASLNCCSVYHANCPRWICGGGSDFAKAWGNSHGEGYDSNIASICMNSDNVCWVGRVGTSGSPDLWNNQSISIQDPGYAWTIGRGFIGMTIDQRAQMSLAAASIGTDINGLAFYCDAMFDDQPKEEQTPVEEPCAGWGVARASDETHVATGIRNASFPSWAEGYDWIPVKDMQEGGSRVLGTNYFVWAKPYDEIRYHDCYYSGLQQHRKDLVSSKKPEDIPQEFIKYYNTFYIPENYTMGFGPSNKTIKAPKLLPLMDAVEGGWADNGYSNSGPGSDGSHIYGKDDDAAMYEYDGSYSVDPLENLGQNNLLNNVHEIDSLFKSGVRRFIIEHLKREWDCNPYWESVEPYRIAYTDGAEQLKCIQNGGSLVDIWTEQSYECNGSVVKKNSLCSLDHDYNNWELTDPTAVAANYFKVPYNFINYGNAVFAPGIVYTGETVSLSSYVVTDQKTNQLTHGTYATKVPNAQWVTALYISKDSDGSDNRPSDGNCSQKECAIIDDMSGSGPLNEGGSISKTEKSLGSGTYNVWDTEAGKYICVVVMVNPATSLYDDNMTGDADIWGNSNPACKQIYKKPTFQIRGGGLYVDDGEVSQDKFAKKNNVRGFIDYQLTGTKDGKTRNYYSWTDQEIVVGHELTLKQFSSGAAANQKRNGYGGLYSSLNTENFILRKYQPLTIPTPTATDLSKISGIGTTLNSSFRERIANSLIGDSRLKDAIVETCSIDSDIVLHAREKKIISCNDILTVKGNILMAGEYTSAEELPFALIYAENGINFSKNVIAIEAWVITGGSINTSYEVVTMNSEAKNDAGRPFTIYGPTVAHSVILKRTAGADAGKASTNPAELFNLSTSTYLTSMSASRASKYINTVYMRELSPRY